MNKKLFSVAAVLALSVVIFSCSKDDDKPSSSFTVDGKTYALATGVDLQYGEVTAGVYGHLIDFSSKASTTSMDYIYVDLYAASANSLPDGTYTFNASSEEALVIASGEVAIGESATAGTYYDITAGTIVVSNSGKKFVFDLTVDGGKNVTGTFNGALTASGL